MITQILSLLLLLTSCTGLQAAKKSVPNVEKLEQLKLPPTIITQLHMNRKLKPELLVFDTSQVPEVETRQSGKISEPIHHVVYSRLDNTLISALEGGAILKYCPDNIKSTNQILFANYASRPPKEAVSQLSLSPDGKHIAIIYANNQVLTANSKTLELRGEFSSVKMKKKFQRIRWTQNSNNLCLVFAKKRPVFGSIYSNDAETELLSSRLSNDLTAQDYLLYTNLPVPLVGSCENCQLMFKDGIKLVENLNPLKHDDLSCFYSGNKVKMGNRFFEFDKRNHGEIIQAQHLGEYFVFHYDDGTKDLFMAKTADEINISIQNAPDGVKLIHLLAIKSQIYNINGLDTL